jgi:hypothetical protein
MKKLSNRITFFGGFLAAYVGLIRPWISRWNATDDELLKTQPGDEIIPHPLLNTTRSVLIQAPAEKVWPWVVQIGFGRGGFYSFDQLERAAGLKGLRSAAEIDPNLQKLKQGDTIHISPVTPMTVEVLKRNRAMVLHTIMSPFTAQPLDPRNPPQPWLDWTWSFLVTPLNEYTCRLASRVRAVYAPYFLLWPLMALGVEPAAFIMDRKMLLTIKERVEA